MNRLLLVGIFLGCFLSTDAQYFYGVKGGLGLNFQFWNSLERDILFTPTIDAYLESHDDEINKLYASVGYHQRGSTIRGFNFISTSSLRFHNAVVELGFKRMLDYEKKYKPYYFLGGRLEYTASTNFSERNGTNVFTLVDETFLNRFNYGVTMGGGFEFYQSPTRVIFIEASINPDASLQYDQNIALTVINPNPTPNNPNNTINLQPQQVRNISIELKIGIKFMQNIPEELWDEIYGEN